MMINVVARLAYLIININIPIFSLSVARFLLNYLLVLVWHVVTMGWDHVPVWPMLVVRVCEHILALSHLLSLLLSCYIWCCCVRLQLSPDYQANEP